MAAATAGTAEGMTGYTPTAHAVPMWKDTPAALTLTAFAKVTAQAGHLLTGTLFPFIALPCKGKAAGMHATARGRCKPMTGAWQDLATGRATDAPVMRVKAYVRPTVVVAKAG